MRTRMTSLFAVCLLALAPMALAQQEAEPGVVAVTGTIATIPNNVFLIIAPHDGSEPMRMEITEASQVENNLSEKDLAKVWYRTEGDRFVVVRAALVGNEFEHDQLGETANPDTQQQAMQQEQPQPAYQQEQPQPANEQERTDMAAGQAGEQRNEQQVKGTVVELERGSHLTLRPENRSDEMRFAIRSDSDLSTQLEEDDRADVTYFTDANNNHILVDAEPAMASWDERQARFDQDEQEQREAGFGQDERLPRTASASPLALLIGLVALAGAAIVAVIRRF